MTLRDMLVQLSDLSFRNGRLSENDLPLQDLTPYIDELESKLTFRAESPTDLPTQSRVSSYIDISGNLANE